jgi:hypothetical protein
LPTKFPLLLKDVDGRTKFIFSDEEAGRLHLRVEWAWEQDENENSQTLPKREKRATHGLAPKGMTIPQKGEAFMVGGPSNATLVPVKESNMEIYNRIREEQEEKKKKKDKRVT